MGFNTVYRVLQDVFPQIDSRLLRAVAIEHSNDADVAVEVVIDEVLPHLREQSIAVNSSNNCMSSLGPFEDGGKTGPLDLNVLNNSYLHEQSTESRFSSVDESLPGAMEALDAGLSADSAQQNSHTVTDPMNVEPHALSSYDDSANCEKEAECGDKIGIINPDSVSREKGSVDNDQVSVKIGGENVASFGEFLLLKESRSSEFIQEEDHTDVTELRVNFEHMHMDVDKKALIDQESNSLPVGICEPNLAVTQVSDPSSSKSTSDTEKDDFAIENVNSGYGSAVTSVLTRSETNCSTDYLEEIIEDAKNNKIILVSSMNSVVDLMKEVEAKEKAAELAKEDVTRGCSDILAKVDEVKQALLRAKEANDMHTGEVNAEKAILATEMKELQLRLFTLSDERNKALEILDEMRRRLEVRFATALKEIASAEEEKLEKERSAREALVQQETRMEKVVQESKRLQQEAEENSKLQEFLMDRGRAIDILQGEISVKCQDVLLLKEKFDKRIPLSRSLSSSQTSSILASSGSSFRSNVTALEPEPEPETFETLEKSTEELSVDPFDKSSKSEVTALQSPTSPIETAYSTGDHFSAGEAKHIDDRKVLLEDGWDFFDTADYMLSLRS